MIEGNITDAGPVSGTVGDMPAPRPGIDGEPGPLARLALLVLPDAMALTVSAACLAVTASTEFRGGTVPTRSCQARRERLGVTGSTAVTVLTPPCPVLLALLASAAPRGQCRRCPVRSVLRG
ncbi:hypothetical protein FHX72_001068 [Pseudoclavibacter helvolus]|uniref:Uncharacterized protein n=1 Tax=Pseudoclavibacter helvolus TaxID=255205 RepID=A0A7W4YFF2_9MICO|nr:hypothetical protein [Pseudoclavibacter helvolus]